MVSSEMRATCLNPWDVRKVQVANTITGGRGAVWVQLETASKLQQTTYENAGECIFFCSRNLFAVKLCSNFWYYTKSFVNFGVYSTSRGFLITVCQLMKFINVDTEQVSWPPHLCWGVIERVHSYPEIFLWFYSLPLGDYIFSCYWSLRVHLTAPF
jgi:hypothetical protein